MSAYIVDRNHIVYLVQSALQFAMSERGGGFRWCVKDEGQQWGIRHEKIADGGDFERAAEVANMLWRENIKSVSHRYPNESSATLPGPIGEDFVIEPSAFRVFGARLNLVQLFKSLDCYAYQTCEHPEWEQSEAFAFVQAMRQTAWHALPGYEDAAWGAPEDERIVANIVAMKPDAPAPEPTGAITAAQVAEIHRIADQGRDAVIAAIRKALKARSGKQWSVTGGRGTAWGWIRIDAPPARKADYQTSPADIAELSELLGIDVHCQGHSIPASSDFYRVALCQALYGHPGNFKAEAYWD